MDYAHFVFQILAEFYARRPKGTGAEQPEENKEENLIDA